MAKGKQTLIVVAIVLILAVLFIKFGSLGGSSQLSTTGGSGACSDVLFDYNGKTYSTYDALRADLGQGVTDDQLNQAGFIVKNDGVYARICQ